MLNGNIEQKQVNLLSVKHTQINCQQFADELFEYVWPYCGVGA